MTWIDDHLLITQKSGEISLVNTNDYSQTKIDHNIPFVQHGQGGLLDIVSEKNFIWVTGSIKKNGKYTTAVYSAELKENKLINENLIYEALPYFGNGKHFGSRIEILDDYLYVSIGERGKGMIAQDFSNSIGSIIRIHKNGEYPKDNPFILGNDWLPELGMSQSQERAIRFRKADPDVNPNKFAQNERASERTSTDTGNPYTEYVEEATKMNDMGYRPVGSTNMSTTTRLRQMTGNDKKLRQLAEEVMENTSEGDFSQEQQSMREKIKNYAITSSFKALQNDANLVDNRSEVSNAISTSEPVAIIVKSLLFPKSLTRYPPLLVRLSFPFSSLNVFKPCLDKANIDGPLYSSAISHASAVSTASAGRNTFRLGVALSIAKCSMG